MNKREELIEKLRTFGNEGFPIALAAAAMLEADAVPQEPVAYSVGNTLLWHIGKGLFNAQLYASPIQWPRLTDAEIDVIADDSIGYSREVNTHYFARLIEKKVRGEA